jgi:hypothetical protein
MQGPMPWTDGEPAAHLSATVGLDTPLRGYSTSMQGPPRDCWTIMYAATPRLLDQHEDPPSAGRGSRPEHEEAELPAQGAGGRRPAAAVTASLRHGGGGPQVAVRDRLCGTPRLRDADRR